MKIFRLTTVFMTLGIVWGIAGCASPTRAWYDGLQTSAQANCDKQPPGAREDCLSRLNKATYDTYNKERATAP